MSCFRAESTGFLQKCFLLDVQLLSPAPKSRSGTLISGRLLLLCFCFRHKNPKIPQKMLTNYHPGGNIYRQSMDCKTEYGRVPEWPMGTDCKSAAFSFGGSNPPAPTKRTSVEITLVFVLPGILSLTLEGGFEQLRRCRRRRRKNSPDGPSGSPGLLLYHDFVDVNIFVMPRKHHM